MPAQPQSVTTTLPLRFAADEHFQTVREFFLASVFTRDAVLQRVIAPLPDAAHAKDAEWGRDPSTAADLLTWIFVLGQLAPRAQVEHFAVPYIVEAMEAVGILARDPHGDYFSPVFVAPLEGLHFAGDRWFNPDGTNIVMHGDVVYPASSPNTLRFLNLLSRTPCQRLLDLGCGSGVLGLTTASHAAHVTLTDITDRSCAFTEFNRRLNSIRNAEVSQGDLFAPVAGQTFDRIVAHPPYVPVLKPNWTFSDGGQDGEFLTRKIVEGLPQYLSVGGLFVCDATGSDRDIPFEQRVREWLGERRSEFDVAVVIRRTHEAREFAARLASRPETGSVAEWTQSFESQGIQRVLQMTLWIQRIAEPRSVFTTRRNFGERESAAAIDWLLRIETQATSGDFEWVMRERPGLPPSLTMQVSSRPGDDGFAPFEYKMTTGFPFTSQSLFEPWMAWLLNLCDSQRTSAELFQMVVENGFIPPDSPPEKFAAFLLELDKSGIIELPSLALPRG